MPDLLDLLAGPSGAENARSRIAKLSSPSQAAKKEEFLYEALGVFLGLSEAYGAETREVVHQVRQSCEAAVLADALACGKVAEESFLAKLCSASEKSLDTLAARVTDVAVEPSIRSNDRLSAALEGFFSWRKFGLLLVETACLVRLSAETRDAVARKFCAASAARQEDSILRILDGVGRTPGCANYLPGLLKLCGIAAVLSTRFPASQRNVEAGAGGKSGSGGGSGESGAAITPVVISLHCLVFAKMAYLEMAWDGELGLDEMDTEHSERDERDGAHRRRPAPEKPAKPGRRSDPRKPRSCAETKRGLRLLDLYQPLCVSPGGGLASSPDFAFTLLYDFAYLAMECVCANTGEIIGQLAARVSAGTSFGAATSVVGGAKDSAAKPAIPTPSERETGLAVQKTLPFALAPLRIRLSELSSAIHEAPSEIREAFVSNSAFLDEAAEALRLAVDLCWSRSSGFVDPMLKFHSEASSQRAALAEGRTVP